MTSIDQHARDEATKALYQIAAHERECKLRAEANARSFQTGSDRMKELGNGISKIDANQTAAERKVLTVLLAGGAITISSLFGATWWLGVKLASITMASNGIVMP